jgi:5-methylcytosine-specific restriction endonuclease McrA
MVRKIITYITNHVKVQHIILGEPRSGSYADYLLLKDGYENKGPDLKGTKKASKFKQMLYNTKFLQFMIKEYGELHCEYCGKKDLLLYHWKYDKVKNNDDMATVDHFLPRATYPELAKDYDNLKVCCHKCNQEKKDDIWDESTLKFPY